MSQLCGSDGSFGPGTAFDCRGGFDFTLTFEESVLGLLPQAIFLLLAPVRLMTLRKRNARIAPGSFLGDIKLVSSTLYAASTCALLVYWAELQSNARTNSSIAAATVEFAGSLVVLLLSRLEHDRAVRPSHLLQLFLLVMLACDAVRLRTLFLMQYPSGLTLTASVHTFLTGWLLLLESWDKTPLLHSERDRRLAPEDTVGVFAAGFFTWLNRLFRLGYSKVLKPQDLFGMGEDLASQHIPKRFMDQWERHPAKEEKNAALWILFRALRADLLRPVLPRLLQVGTEISQPFLITRMVAFVTASPEEQSNNVGYGLIAAFALAYILRAVFSSWARQSVSRFQVQARACLITALYEHTLRISPRVAEVGSATSLMNVDVEKIILALKSLHEYWAVLLEAGIALYLLWQYLGLITISPLIVIVGAIWLTLFIGSKTRPRQRLWVEATQRRVTAISHAASSLKAIRMLGLNETVHRSLTALREREVHLHKRIRQVALLITVTSNLMVQFSTVASFVPFAIVSIVRGGSLDLTLLFASLSALKLFCTPLLSCMQTLTNNYSALASMDRIQEYLSSETTTQQFDEGTIRKDGNDDANSLISLKDASFEIEPGNPILKHIDLSVSPGQFIMVVGKVASGKSVLLRSLIGETQLIGGTCEVASGGIAYCHQSPWLRNATLRANILGQSDFDPQWYRTVVWACGLSADFAQLKDGDATQVGSKGISLSGGQKNRVSLARALYSRKSLLVVDDMLSGLDNTTEQLVFSRVFGPKGILRRSASTTVLATHSVHHLHKADNTVILEAGTIVEQGPYESLATSYEQLQKLGLESRSHGTTDAEEEETLPTFEAEITESTERSSLSQADDEQNDGDRRSGDLRSMVYFIRSVGKSVAITYFINLILATTSTNVQLIWLKLWAADNDTSTGAMVRNLGIFLGITLANVILLSFWIAHTFLVWVPKSSLTMHAKQLGAFMHAQYSYITRVDTGSITNRFSQDVVMIDTMLQIAWFNTTVEVMTISWSIGITIVATYPVAAVVPFVGAVCWIIQRVYLRTSRQIRLMDLEAKAPLCTHFLETLAGIMSVRSFGWTEGYSAENADLLHRSQVPLYLMYSIQNWLTLVLQLMVAGVVIAVVVSGVLLRGKIDPGFLGLALVGIMDLSETLYIFVTMWTELETCLSAVSRVLKFSSKTPQEPSAPQAVPELEEQAGDTGLAGPSKWPSAGQIEFDNVSASYSPDSDNVLKGVSLSIQAGEKIGICGRTGSGKSSLVMTLFGLLDQRHELGSEIRIDGVPTTKAPLEALRSSIIALPQDPFFLPGTVRENLVPHDAHGSSTPSPSELPLSDSRLEAALETVGLLSKLKGLAAQGAVLDLPLTSAEAVLSAGERQLFCLARATLMDGRRIVVLDEATSSVDRRTDERMQAIVRREFAGRTVIAIAHRLDTILDFDRVAVMEAGRIVEIGAPDVLMGSARSRFRELVEAQRGARGEDQ